MAPPPLPPRRPTLVWIIFLFYTVSGGFSLIFQLEMLLGVARLPPQTQAILGTMSTSEHLFAFGLGALSLAAAISLWRLRRVALPLFSLHLLLTLGSTAWHLQPGGLYTGMMAQGALMSAVTLINLGVSILIVFGIWFYTFHLWRRGVLT